VIEEEEPRTIRDDANDVYNAMRAITSNLEVIHPAPTVYSILGNLKLASGDMLERVLDVLGDGLSESLIRYDVYEDDGSDPAASVAEAKQHMARAADLARQIYGELSSAQSALNSQGYRTPGDVGYRKPEDRK
jgi:hypothetical protein